MRRKGKRTLVLYSITFCPITKSEPEPPLRAKAAHSSRHLLTGTSQSGQQGYICVETIVMERTLAVISIPLTSNPTGRASTRFTSVSFTLSFYKSSSLPVERCINAQEASELHRECVRPFNYHIYNPSSLLQRKYFCKDGKLSNAGVNPRTLWENSAGYTQTTQLCLRFLARQRTFPIPPAVP